MLISSHTSPQLGTYNSLGLMLTAAAVYWILHALNFTVQIRNVCVLLAPWFASNTSLVTYFFTKEVSDSPSAGLIGAAMIAIVPGTTLILASDLLGQ